MKHARPLLATAMLLISGILAGCVVRFPRTAAALPAGTTAATLPATFDDGWIDVEVSINGHEPQRLCFDTGASYGVLTTQAARELGLHTVGKVFGTDIFDKEVTGRLVVAKTVRCGDLTLTNVPFLVTDAIRFFTDDRDLDGLLGIPGFDTLTVDIDSPNQALRVTTEPLDPADTATVPLHHEHGQTPRIWYTAANKAAQTHQGWATLDTGGETAIQLSKPDTRSLVATQVRRTFTRSFGLSGHAEPHRLAPLAGTLRLGDVDLPQIEAETDTPDTLIGHRLLRHLRVQLDFPERRATITAPEPTVELPRYHDVGATQVIMHDHELVLLAIRDGSPAARAGIRPNDRVTAVGGVPVTDPARDLSWCGTRSPKPEYTLTIKRDDQTFDVTLAPEPSFPDDLDQRGPDLEPPPARIITNPDGSIQSIEFPED